MPQRQTMPKQATRLMGGPQPKANKLRCEMICRQLTPGLGLGMGMEPAGGPPPPDVDYFYLRPASTDRYLRPDGTSYYIRP